MKKSIFFLAILMITTLALTPVDFVVQGSQSAEIQFGAALHKEEVEGNYEAAIEAYKKLLSEFPDNRPLAARAQYRIGVCYEKLGLKEAENAFQKVVDDFPDQKETVKMAREKLSILQRARAIIEKEDQGIKITEIPIDPEKNYYSFAFISPDGKKLASVDLEGDIWITDVASGKEIQLTKSPEFKSLCYWSPDSQKIAYVGILNNTYNLYVVSAQGGTPKTLIKRDEDFVKENGEFWPLSWSPDSQNINCALYKKGLVAIPISGGEWKDIYKFSNPEQPKIDFYPGTLMYFSPDEKYIAFTKNSENLDIYIMPTQGGESAQITDHPAKDFFGAWWSWSCDGRWLVFNSDRNGNTDPWIIEISPDGKRRGEPFQIPFMSTANVHLISWTKAGQIGLSTGKVITNLFVSNSDGGEEFQLTNMECMEMGPVWSPDNKYIAYISSDFGTKREVWIMPVQGGEPQKISGHMKTLSRVDNIFDIAWHPNGRSVSCVVRYEDDRGPWMVGPWMIDIQSGFSQKIPFGYDGSMSAMEWSPDGKMLAFDYTGEEGAMNVIKDSEDEYSNIYTMPTTGGEPVRITQGKEDGSGFSSPRWSPDGKRIAFKSSDHSRLWVVDSAGGEPHAITDKIGMIKGYCWSPDGKDILFARYEGREDGNAIYYSVSSQGGELRKINIEGSWGLDISPDGKKIVYCRTLKTINQYWLLENFLPEDKKD